METRSFRLLHGLLFCCLACYAVAALPPALLAQDRPQQPQENRQARPAPGAKRADRPASRPGAGNAGRPQSAARPQQHAERPRQTAPRPHTTRPAPAHTRPVKPQTDRPSHGRPQPANRPAANRPTGHRPPANRPAHGRPTHGRPSHGRAPQWGRPPHSRPSYSFRPTDRDRLRRYYAARMRAINRANRPVFTVGGYYPYEDIVYLQPVPTDVYGYLPPPPPGYQMGYYDGYVVVYDPVTYFIANLVDLFQ